MVIVSLRLAELKHNHANRLAAVSSPGGTAIYAYSGLGDRLQQTVGMSTTNYTIDTSASGLTQVLADGTTTFVNNWTRLKLSGII